MTTNNHQAHGPVSLDRLHQISEILSKAAAQSDGGNLGYAMADAVKVIDGAIASFGAEPVAIVPVMYKGVELLKKDGLELIRDGIAEATELESMCMAKALLSARPAPVVPEWTNEQCLEFLSIAFRHAEIKGDLELDDIRLGVKMVNGGRAAMLQAGNSPSKCSLRDGIEAIRNSGIPVDVDKIQSECEGGNHTEQHLDMVDHSGDANQKVDFRLPFAQWLSQQNEPIDVDCGCVTTEAFYHWLRVAYEAANSPVTPDGWIPVSERMPERDVDVQVYCADKKEQMVAYMESNETEGWFRFASLPNGGGVYCKPTHWMPLPAPPQQEE